MAWPLAPRRCSSAFLGLPGLCSGKDKSPRSVSLRLLFVREDPRQGSLLGIRRENPRTAGSTWGDGLALSDEKEGNLGSGDGEGVGTERKEGRDLSQDFWVAGRGDSGLQLNCYLTSSEPLSQANLPGSAPHLALHHFLSSYWAPNFAHFTGGKAGNGTSKVSTLLEGGQETRKGRSSARLRAREGSLRMWGCSYR